MAPGAPHDFRRGLWIFHPFTPFQYSEKDEETTEFLKKLHRYHVPFYETVNRFVVGPQAPKMDPREQRRRILVEIRRQRGRVGLEDVMRITGSSREEAARLLLQLIIAHNGDIDVAENGAIIYRFSSLRTTAGGDNGLKTTPPIWDDVVFVQPLTGNSVGANASVFALSAFNLGASAFAFLNDLTVQRVRDLYARLDHPDLPLLPAPDGHALVLGVIPLVFSVTLFVMPLLRALRRIGEQHRVSRENGRRQFLKFLLTTSRSNFDFKERELVDAWAQCGLEPTKDDLVAAVQAAGGQLELTENGELIYRFKDLERERRALDEARRVASDEEAHAGNIVFSSSDEGTGIREDAELAEWDRRLAGRARLAGEAPDAPASSRSGIDSESECAPHRIPLLR